MGQGIMYLLGNSLQKVSELKKVYRCHQPLADWLMKRHRVPLLAIDKGEYVFAKTKELDECLSNIPLMLRVSEYLA